MKSLDVLEQRISQLVDVITSLKAENAQLLQEKEDLSKNIGSMESSMLKEQKNSTALSKEQETTRTVVDDLIKHIDSLLPHEDQS